MTHATSKDIFLGRKQEDFDLAEKLLVKHGELSDKCVREMADALFGRIGIVECHKILQRVWNDMHVKKLEDENAKLRDWCSDLLHMAESNDPDFLHWPEIHDELRKLGVEIVKL